MLLVVGVLWFNLGWFLLGLSMVLVCGLQMGGVCFVGMFGFR